MIVAKLCASRRRPGRLRALHGDRGSVVVELVIATPLLLLALLTIIQLLLWSHATHVAQAAASQALAAARAQDGTPDDGEEAGDRLLAALAAGPLRDPRIDISRDADRVLVVVRGEAAAVLPGIHLPVHAEAAGSVERFIPLADEFGNSEAASATNRKRPVLVTTSAQCLRRELPAKEAGGCPTFTRSRLSVSLVLVNLVSGWCTHLRAFRLQQDGAASRDRCEACLDARHMSTDSIGEVQPIGVDDVEGRRPAFFSDLTTVDSRVLLPESLIHAQRRLNNFRLTYKPDRGERLVPSHPVDRCTASPLGCHCVVDPGGLGEDVGANVDLFTSIPQSPLRASGKSGAHKDAYQGDQCARCARSRNL